MKEAWRQDRYLCEIANNISCFDVVSIDVFDTLLFRMCDAPADVFELIGLKMQEQAPKWHYAPSTYRALRIEAEKRAIAKAKKLTAGDCKFEEIIREMPFDISTAELLAGLEIECEKEVLFLNENAHNFLRFFKRSGKIIVLTTEMYHSKEQILEFLSFAGLDVNMVDDCFVSSEYGCFKADGKLFEKVTEAYPEIPSKRILHIGDSKLSDVEGAASVDITAVLYPVIPRQFGNLYDYEKHLYGVNLGELTCIRKLSSAMHPYTGNERCFFELGAEVIGPVYSLFAEWVVRYAKKRGVKVILPLMREGELLSEVINRTLSQNDPSIVCKPAYISRSPAFVSSIYVDNYDIRISEAMLRGNRTLESFFSELGLDAGVYALPFPHDATLDELKQNGSAGIVINILKTDKVKETILRYARTQRELLKKYFSQLCNGEAFLTVDVGTRGTTERYLSEIYKRDSSSAQPIHALLFGTKSDNVENILNGVDIASWLGLGGENSRLIDRISSQVMILETFVNASCGSTESFSPDNDVVMPNLGPDSISESQKKLIDVCWEGISTFQEQWLKFSKLHPGLADELLERKESFLSILLRFVEMPLYEEAINFRELEYFDRYTSIKPSKLIGEIGLSAGEDPKEYIAQRLIDRVAWPQAQIAISRRDYFNEIMIASLHNDPAQEAIIKIVKEIKGAKLKNGVIFGASVWGRKIKEVASILGVNPVCFVDNDEKLHGKEIDGTIVISLDDVGCPVDYYVVASFIFAKEIKNIIEAKYRNAENKPKIYTFGSV